MNLQTLRDELREDLGVDDQDLDDNAADLLLNRSYLELQNKFPFREKDHRLDFDLVIGTYKYDLGSSLVAIETVSIIDLITEEKDTLERMTKTWYEDNTSLDTDARGKPCRYMRESGCIILYPTPDKVYRLTVRCEKSLATLVGQTDAPDIPAVWHEILQMGAVWRGFKKLGDYDRAENEKQHQVALITSTVPEEAKEEFDTHTGGVIVRGRENYKRYQR